MDSSPHEGSSDATEKSSSIFSHGATRSTQLPPGDLDKPALVILNAMNIDPGALPHNVQRRLDLLVRVADALSIEDVSFSSYSDAISRLSTDELALCRSLNQMEFAEETLHAHVAWAQHEDRLITRWKATLLPSEDDELWRDEIATLASRKAAILIKAKEYQYEFRKLQAEMPVEPSLTITDLISKQRSLREKEQQIRAKRTKLKAFEGLPPNIELARHELQISRDEQLKLMTLRERLLRKMAESVI